MSDLTEWTEALIEARQYREEMARRLAGADDEIGEILHELQKIAEDMA